MLALTIREKSGEERQLIIDQEDVTIGRAAGSDIVLPRSNISKRHARLVDKHDKVVIVDLRSTNGTYVNGRRITAPELLTFDDKVYIGDFVIRLTRPEEQHASQRLSGPFTAGPPGGAPAAEPRGSRLRTQAADVAVPPAARFVDDAPPPPPPRRDPPPMAPPPPPPPSDELEEEEHEEATRAVDGSMIEAIEAQIAAQRAARAAPPPPPEPPPPQIEPPAPRAEPLPRPELKPSRGTAEFGARVPLPRPPMPPPREEPPAQAEPDEDAISTQAMPVLTDDDLRDSAPTPAELPVFEELPPEAAPPEAPPVEAVPEAEATPPDEAAPAEEAEAAPEADAWAAWNMAIGLLVRRFEEENEDDLAPEDTQRIVEDLLESAISNAEINHDIDREALTEDVVGELVSIGPLGDLEGDPSVRIAFLNGPQAIFTSRGDGGIEASGRVFATSRSYRRALRLLTRGTSLLIADAETAVAGLQEGRLGDGSYLRVIEPGGGADPIAVWRRGRARSATLEELVGDGTLTKAQGQAIASAAAHGENILLCGAPSDTRDALGAAIAAAYGTDRRVIRVGDGGGMHLPHFNQATLLSDALMGAAEVCALEPELVIFEPLDGRLIGDWLETALMAGCPVLAVTAEGDVVRALRRAALAVELQTGAQAGLGDRLVREAVTFTVGLSRGKDGQVRVHSAAPVGK